MIYIGQADSMEGWKFMYIGIDCIFYSTKALFNNNLFLKLGVKPKGFTPVGKESMETYTPLANCCPNLILRTNNIPDRTNNDKHFVASCPPTPVDLDNISDVDAPPVDNPVDKGDAWAPSREPSVPPVEHEVADPLLQEAGPRRSGQHPVVECIG